MKSKSFSKLGISAGFLALVALLTAITNNFWLYTYEPIVVDVSDKTETVATFRIGLWTVCSMLMENKQITSQKKGPSFVQCKAIKYFTATNASSGFVNAFIAKMRISTPLLSLSLFFLITATLLSVISYCSNTDYRTIVACGLFLLAGLSLGSGLFMYAVTVSDTYLKLGVARNRNGSLIEFSYGWCYFVAALAFLLSEFAVFFLVMAYTKRFVSVEQMVYKTIPGAKRKLNEIMLAIKTSNMAKKPVANKQLVIRNQSDHEDSDDNVEKTPAPDLCAILAKDVDQIQSLLNKKQKYFTLQNHLRTQSLSAYQQLSCYYHHQQLHNPNQYFNMIHIPKQKQSVRFAHVLANHRLNNNDNEEDDEEGSAV